MLYHSRVLDSSVFDYMAVARGTQNLTLRHGPRRAGAEAAFSAMLSVLAATLEAAEPGGLSLPSG